MSIVSVARPDGESEVLDRDALAKLAQLDPSGQSRLVERVLSTYQGSLARLRQQIADGCASTDASALRMGAHTLKSSSASIGALHLSRLCAEVEQSIRDGSTDALPGLVAQLQCEADRVDGAIRRLMAA